MVGAYDYWLVLLSVVVAIMSSYVALDLAHRVAEAGERNTRRYWLAGGALSMGSGIWAMHFIGMLAFSLPVPISFDIPITLLSLAIPIAVAGFALHLVSRSALTLPRLAVGGALIGIGIAAMHYTGMAAMRMDPPIRYEPVLFALSILIAVSASIAAPWGALRMRMETIPAAFWKKAGSAIVMGTAIYGMHYTGMAAAVFAPNSICAVSPQNLHQVGLAVTLGGFTLLFLTATLLVSAFDAYLAGRSSKHAETLRGLNTRLEEEARVRAHVEEALRQAQAGLEVRVAERTAALEHVNRSLVEEIAQRTRAQETMRETQVRTESILNSIGELYIVFDPQWRYLYVNEAAVRAIGRPREQILGRTLWELYPDIVGTELDRQYRRAMDERVPVVFDFHYPALDTWWENRFYPAPEGLAVFAVDITERKKAAERIGESEARLLAYTAQLQALSRRLVDAEETYRRQLARELHDRVGQNLTALNINLEMALNGMPPELRQALAPRLTDSIALVNATAETISDVLSELRPPILDEYGLLAALRSLARQFTQRTGIRVAVKGEASSKRLNSMAEIALYRIAQEALNNVAKHASATQVEIALVSEPHRVSLTIADDGTGFIPGTTLDARSGWGMITMRERAEAVGGALTVDSAPGKGTHVRATLAR